MTALAWVIALVLIAAFEWIDYRHRPRHRREPRRAPITLVVEKQRRLF